MAPQRPFPDILTGRLVTLRRHTPENLAAFRRWYADPEIARLARYQQTPMRSDEIERFFTARVVGPDALAMAVHERSTDRLVGTCAFSQMDGDNGSALFHITIGEPDTWGRGFGTEATRLMIDHAFGVMGLHRIALYVFEFNVRAIRAYRRCGFVVEGRSRESIWREDRWWDELAMSILESDWRAARAGGAADGSADGVDVDTALESGPRLPAQSSSDRKSPGQTLPGQTVPRPAASVRRRGPGLVRRAARRFT
jgi:RimJ/RimL family protein N-acetyltransferase